MKTATELERTYVKTSFEIFWYNQNPTNDFKVFDYVRQIHDEGFLSTYEFSHQDMPSESGVKLTVAPFHRDKAQNILTEIYKLIDGE